MNRLKNAVILVLVFTMFFPAIAGAAPQADVRIPPRLPIPAKGSPALQITWVTDEQGIAHRIAHRTVPEGDGQRLDFWLIENNAELAALVSYISLEGTSAMPLPDGFKRMPKGSWVWWDDDVVVMFISHDTAVTISGGLAVIGIFCGMIATMAYLEPTTKVCFVAAGLSAAAIIIWDDLGEPGFRIVQSRSSGAISIRP